MGEERNSQYRSYILYIYYFVDQETLVTRWHCGKVLILINYLHCNHITMTTTCIRKCCLTFIGVTSPLYPVTLFSLPTLPSYILSLKHAINLVAKKTYSTQTSQTWFIDFGLSISKLTLPKLLLPPTG